MQKIVGTCNGEQLRNYYKKFTAGKMSLMNLMRGIRYCSVRVAMMEVCAKITVHMKNFTEEEFNFFVDELLCYAWLGSSRCYSYNEKIKDNIFQLFNCNVPFKNKQKLFLRIFDRNDNESKILMDWKDKTQLTYQEQVDIIIYSLDNSKKNKQTIAKRALALFIRICDLYKNPEIKKYVYNVIQNKIINNSNMALHEYQLKDFQKTISETFNDLVPEEHLYGYIKEKVTSSVGDNYNIKKLMDNNFPFGMVVKAFVEIYTQNILSLEQDIIDQLNASMTAVKLIKNG